MEIVASTVELVKTIGEMLAVPIGAQCGYLISYEDNISNMKSALEALKVMKQGVQRRVDIDRNNGREIEPLVEKWLRDAAEIEASVDEEEANKRDKKCLGGLCPNLKTRYSSSRNAKKNTAKLLQLQLKEQTFGSMSTPAPPLKYGEFFSSKGIKSFESRNEIIRGVIKMLKDERCDRISICGMGGVGKTTLVREVIKIVEAENLFQHIAMVAVSQTPDCCKIQVEIARRLGLELTDKDFEQSRAEKLLKRIKKSDGGVLIVLDDVWKELGFESIGLPSNGDHKACKIIFTSRNEGTCSKMGSKKTFTVNTLSRVDSWALFQEITGGDVVNNPVIRPIAEDIANECGGLPIAIVTVGKALQGNTDEYIWENALNDLTKSSGSFSEVEKCIALSYNLLDKDKAKPFLFLCCSFPEDFDIPIEDVVREGWGLGWFQDQDALWKARNKAHALVNDLKKCYLLLDSDKKECIKMHDVVRDVITSIASKEESRFEIQCGAQINTWINIACSSVSVAIDDLKERPNVEEYPKLTVLRVESKRRKSIPTDLFRGMSMLKALCLQNSGISNISTLFSRLKNLRTLRLEDCQVGDVSIIGKELPTLEILSFACSNITELPTEIGNLGSLRLLDLTGCDGLYKFSSNVLVRLSQLEELYLKIDSFPWMENTDFLTELKTISSRQLKVIEIQVRKVEPFLKDLVFENVRRFWFFMVPNAYYAKQHGYMESNILHLRAVDYNSIKCSMTLKHLVKRCEILIIKKVKNLKNIISSLEEGAGLSCLKDLKISQCYNLECLIDDGEVHKSMIGCSNLVSLELSELPKLICFTKANGLNKSNQSMHHQFSRLETISLQNCNSLKMIFDLQGFQNLRALTISYCDSLTHIFHSDIDGIILELEKLEIKSCHGMKNIVGGSRDYKEEEYNGKEKVKTIVFKRLHSFILSKLPELESICTNCYEIEWPSLRKLDIDHCPMLKTPLSQMLTAIQDNVGVTSYSNTHHANFDNLKENKLRYSNRLFGCIPLLSRLSHQATTNMAINKTTMLTREQISSTFKMKSNIGIYHMPILEDTSVRKCDGLDVLFLLKENYNRIYLKSIKIEDCDKLESIIAKRETEIEMMNCFAELHTLDLKNLPNLSRFCYSVASTSFNEYEDQGTCEGEQKQMKLDPFIDVFLFPSLRSLLIKGCNKICILFSLSSLRSLECLEELHLQDCKNVEEIVSQEEIEASANKIMCPKLLHLLLHDLSNLKAFSQGCHNFDFPSLQKVEIKGCSNMEMFSPGSLKIPKLEDFEMDIGPHKKDFNSIIKGFKAFVASQGSKKQSYNDPHNEGIVYFTKTSKIGVKECHELSMIVPSNEIDMLQNVRELKVAKCNSLIEVLESKGGVDVKEGEVITYELQSMELRELPQLRHILGLDITKLVSFNKLESIIIESCHCLKSLMSYSMVESLVQLKKLQIKDCKTMEGIVTKEYDNRDRGIKVETMFPKLRELDLANLPELECFFCMGDNNYNIIWDGEDRKIEKMCVGECPKLVSLAPFIEIRMLQHVRNLNIQHCDSLAEVFASGGGMDEKKGNVTAHYEMKVMYLSNLPRLRHIWGSNIIRVDSFNKLASIRIEGCHSLKSLLSHSMARSLVQLEELTVINCEIMEEIVTMGDENMDDEGSKVEILFPKLKVLHLYGLPKLECICSGYYGYDIPLCDEEEEDKEINNKQQVQISLPLLEELYLRSVPRLKCFYRGAYDYELLLSSSYCVEDRTQVETFPHGNVTVRTPNLFDVEIQWVPLRTMGDINLTIHYIQNSEKHKVELQKLGTFRCIEQHQYQHLLAYIRRVRELELESCHKLWSCVPSNMMHFFQHLVVLRVQECGCLEEIFEPSDYEGMELWQLELRSLPKLKHIWGNPGSMSSFQNLGYLKISECHDLKFVFPDASVARSLPRLEWLEVSKCNKIEEIIPDNNTNDSIPKGAKIIFPQLFKIRLSTLPKLNCFCPSSFHFELPRCVFITIEGCPEMKTFCSGTLYTPRLGEFSVEGKQFDTEEDVNEGIQEIQRH